MKLGVADRPLELEPRGALLGGDGIVGAQARPISGREVWLDVAGTRIGSDPVAVLVERVAERVVVRTDFACIAHGERQREGLDLLPGVGRLIGAHGQIGRRWRYRPVFAFGVDSPFGSLELLFEQHLVQRLVILGQGRVAGGFDFSGCTRRGVVVHEWHRHYPEEHSYDQRDRRSRIDPQECFQAISEFGLSLCLDQSA